MQTWDAITARRNVRDFATGLFRPRTSTGSSRPAAARRRRSNWQPWDFVLVIEPSQLRELSKVWQGAYVAQAQAVVAIVGQIQTRSASAVAAVRPGPGADEHDDRRRRPRHRQRPLRRRRPGLARRVLGLPDDRDCVTCCRSATRRTGRSHRCGGRTAARSTRSCTAAAGRPPLRHLTARIGGQPLPAPAWRGVAQPVGSHLHPSLFSQMMVLPSPATPVASWSLVRQNSPGS